MWLVLQTGQCTCYYVEQNQRIAASAELEGTLKSQLVQLPCNEQECLQQIRVECPVPGRSKLLPEAISSWSISYAAQMWASRTRMPEALVWQGDKCILCTTCSQVMTRRACSSSSLSQNQRTIWRNFRLDLQCHPLFFPKYSFKAVFSKAFSRLPESAQHNKHRLVGVCITDSCHNQCMN